LTRRAWNQPRRLHGRLRLEPVRHPLREQFNSRLLPGTFPSWWRWRHYGSADSTNAIVNGDGMLLNVIVTRQVKCLAHALNVSLRKERANIFLKTRRCSHSTSQVLAGLETSRLHSFDVNHQNRTSDREQLNDGIVDTLVSASLENSNPFTTETRRHRETQNQFFVNTLEASGPVALTRLRFSPCLCASVVNSSPIQTVRACPGWSADIPKPSDEYAWRAG
jgi:hypothetical protein